MKFTQREIELMIEALEKQKRSYVRAAHVDGADEHTESLLEVAEEIERLLARIVAKAAVPK